MRRDGQVWKTLLLIFGRILLANCGMQWKWYTCEVNLCVTTAVSKLWYIRRENIKYVEYRIFFSIRASRFSYG